MIPTLKEVRSHWMFCISRFSKTVSDLGRSSRTVKRGGVEGRGPGQMLWILFFFFNWWRTGLLAKEVNWWLQEFQGPPTPQSTARPELRRRTIKQGGKVPETKGVGSSVWSFQREKNKQGLTHGWGTGTSKRQNFNLKGFWWLTSRWHPTCFCLALSTLFFLKNNCTSSVDENNKWWK